MMLKEFMVKFVFLYKTFYKIGLWLNVFDCQPCPSSLWLKVTELESLPQDVSRSAYTQRILEIVGNIKKQKEEITKVCSVEMF